MNQQDRFSTRKDVEEIVGKAVTELSEVISDSLSMISKRFDEQDKKIDAKADRTEMNQRFDKVDATLNRIENRLDATCDKVDDHEVRIGRLEHQAA